MSEIKICKNCGKEIESYMDNEWYHINNHSMLCYPTKIGEPDEEYCHAKISINGVQYHCELTYGHTGLHELEFQSSVLTSEGFIPNQYEIKW